MLLGGFGEILMYVEIWPPAPFIRNLTGLEIRKIETTLHTAGFKADRFKWHGFIFKVFILFIFLTWIET